jgi:aerobic carbon-monoxide dehydrogenase medium subunit
VSDIKYLAPQSLREAMVLIHEYRGLARIMAGGTDILARLKKGQEAPQVLINIEAISELDYIDFNIVDGLNIGASTSLSAIEKSALIHKNFPVLEQTAALMASPTIRSCATIGGNLGNAAPSADIAPSLLVLGASIRISGFEGEKLIPVEEFFTGPGQNILSEGQIISGVHIPVMAPYSGAVFLKQKRREGADLSVASTAVMVTLNKNFQKGDNALFAKQNDIIEEARIALGAVAPTPIRARRSEDILRGQKATEAPFAEAGRVASAESQPIDDVRSSADYRRKLISALVPRAIQQAIEIAKQEVQR